MESLKARFIYLASAKKEKGRRLSPPPRQSSVRRGRAAQAPPRPGLRYSLSGLRLTPNAPTMVWVEPN